MKTVDVTQVSVGSLEQLRGALQTILDEVNGQLAGQGPPGSGPVVIVDPDLQVQGGSTDFNVAGDLNTALSEMGGTVQSQLTWLSKTLAQMMAEITDSIGSMSSTDTLNADQVNALIAEFENTTGVQPGKYRIMLADLPGADILSGDECVTVTRDAVLPALHAEALNYDIVG